MKSYAVCLAIGGLLLAGCSGAGGGTADRNAKRDSVLAAVPPPPPAGPKSDQPLPPMPPEPQLPPVTPTGWGAFDKFYDQLMNVASLEEKKEGNVPADQLKALVDASEILAKDTDPMGKNSVAQRGDLPTIARRTTEVPATAPISERVRSLQPLLQTAMVVAQSITDKDMGPYIQHLQMTSARVDLIAVRLSVQHP